MVRPLFAAAIASALVATSVAVSTTHARSAVQDNPVVVLQTAKGDIEIELFPAEAPKSVERVLELVKHNFYRGLRFHWVQPGVVQFGDPQSRDMTKQNTWGTGGSGPSNRIDPLGVVEKNKRKFDRGIVGLAYRVGSKPETADCQIFILKGPNTAADGKYASIGRVIKGMDVVDKIQLTDRIVNLTLKK
jgi:peptidyl-prolyl cis-trans isomerase B (cyclophilin B)